MPLLSHMQSGITLDFRLFFRISQGIFLHCTFSTQRLTGYLSTHSNLQLPPGCTNRLVKPTPLKISTSNVDLAAQPRSLLSSHRLHLLRQLNPRLQTHSLRTEIRASKKISTLSVPVLTPPFLRSTKPCSVESARLGT
jgi:hypothetical protein